MRRAGFTMIELIFVIVVLGILAAVALPKFIGVSEQAEAAKCKAFVGTMNRTVFPAVWSKMMAEDLNETTAFTATTLGEQIDFGVSGKEECGTAKQYADAASAGKSFTVTVAGKTYDVNATKASKTTSPVLGWKAP